MMVGIFTAVALAMGGRVTAGSEGVTECVPSPHTVPFVREEVVDGGIVAAFFRPRAPGRHPAIVVLRGSRGGKEPVRKLAAPFAKRGYAVLALSYFGAPGLPDHLEEIPLETFTRGIDWLVRQESVDPARIGIYGVSKGAEAALLVASRDRRLVAVAAGVPSNVVWQNINRTDFTPRSSWSEGGKPLPFVPYDFSRGFISVFQIYDGALAHLDEHREAIIPVQRIHGPILLISGAKDTLWPSTRMANMVMRRLDEKGFAFAHRHLRYEDAGHAVAVPPELPGDPRFPARMLGGSDEGNAEARADMWRHLLCFFQNHLKPETARSGGNGS